MMNYAEEPFIYLNVLKKASILSYDLNHLKILPPTKFIFSEYHATLNEDGYNELMKIILEFLTRESAYCILHSEKCRYRLCRMLNCVLSTVY